MQVSRFNSVLSFLVVLVGLLALPVNQHAHALDFENLSTSEIEIIKKVEDYFHTLKSFRGNFTQLAEDGRYAEGMVYFSRPGKLRFEYSSPSGMLLVARGKYAAIRYRDGEEAYNFYVSDYPVMRLLMDEAISFEKDFELIDLRRQRNVLEVLLSLKDKPETGTLTLQLTESPLELRQWRHTDADDKTVLVSLYNAETGLRLRPSLFELPTSPAPESN